MGQQNYCSIPRLANAEEGVDIERRNRRKGMNSKWSEVLDSEGARHTAVFPCVRERERERERVGME